MPSTFLEMAEAVRGFVGDSGSCNIDRAKKAVNAARELLWDKRSWTSTEEYFRVCCADCCFTMPNRYEQIKLAWYGKHNISLADEWFTSTDAYGNRADQSCHRLITEVGGRHVVFQDYTTAPYQIAVMVEHADDIGVEITFQAQDEYSTYHTVPITTVNPPNRALSSIRVKGLRAVTKPRTKGRVRVYAYNPDSNSSLLLAIYQPQDINPWFRRFRLPKQCNYMTIYAARKYFDLEDDSDLVEFKKDSMIFAVLALNSRDNRKAQEYLTNLGLAISEEEKAMEGEEIPTASPIKFVDSRRPEGLIDRQALFGAQDYYFWP
jgi:hypothetical protein